MVHEGLVREGKLHLFLTILLVMKEREGEGFCPSSQQKKKKRGPEIVQKTGPPDFPLLMAVQELGKYLWTEGRMTPVYLYDQYWERKDVCIAPLKLSPRGKGKGKGGGETARSLLTSEGKENRTRRPPSLSAPLNPSTREGGRKKKGNRFPDRA